MSERNPNIRYFAGSGKPRLIAVKSPMYRSDGATAFSDSSVQEAEGTAIPIVNSTAGYPSCIVTASPHGFVQGEWVRIASHAGSIPDINGIYQVLEVLGASSFTIAVNVTASGAAGTVRRTSAFVNRGLLPNQRISVDTGTAVSFAKILSIDISNNAAPVLIVDGWSNGTPENGSAFVIDGVIADLPRCKEMTEIHSPSILLHHLYRGRTNAKQFGWTYQCTLDYSSYLSADAILGLIDQLNIGEEEALILIPRIDAPEYQYNVFYKDDVQISMFGLSPGYRKVVLSFEATELQCFPKPLTGYGAGYGWNYGVEL